MKRDRKAYALRRLSLACDRVIAKHGDVSAAKKWANAWATLAGINTNR